MLTSKDVLEKTGISRATLNNYIALGILPKPVVRRAAAGQSRAPRIGYFPSSAVDIIRRVNDLKRRKFSMAQIPEMVRNTHLKRVPGDSADCGPEMPAMEGGPPPPPADSKPGLRLTVDQIDYPAYLVNNNFEIEWCNREAETQILGQLDGLSSEITECNVFKMLLKNALLRKAEGKEDLLGFHLSIAKKRLSRETLIRIAAQLESSEMESLLALYDKSEVMHSREILHREINLGAGGAEGRWHNVYASFFREGIFFVYAPTGGEDGESETLLNLLARRDMVIRDLLKHRRPYLTPLGVVVADLQNSVKICAELPPEEYFELINDIWGTMEPLLRKYYATHGKHVGDGMVYYFFPQPDCSYVENTIRCAFEMKEAMREVSRRWRIRKNWLNELELNIGLEEGEEWFGTYQTPTHVEFTVLGDSINRASRLSDFATSGSIWVTKSMLGKLDPDDLKKVAYGIRRKDEQGEKMLIPATYSRISNLIDLDNPKYHKFQDIAVLTVTEILDLLEDGDMAEEG